MPLYELISITVAKTPASSLRELLKSTISTIDKSGGVVRCINNHQVKRYVGLSPFMFPTLGFPVKY